MVFYFYGPNSYAIKHQVDTILKKYLDKTGDDVDLLQVDLAEVGFDDLLSNLAAVPMFVSSRLIVANNVSLAKPTEQQLDKIIEYTPDSTNLVLTDTKADKRTLVFKLLSKLKHAKEFKQLEYSQLVNWVIKESKLAGATMDTKVAQYLLERAGEDQWKLHSEISKLTSSGDKITTDLISELISPSLDNNAFDLAEALVAKDLRRVLNLYEQLLLDGQADPAILGAIIYQYRMILLVKLNSSELNKAYSVSSYSTQKARQISQKINMTDIKVIYNQLREADIATKTGRLSSHEAMKQMFYLLCNRQT